MMYLVPGRWAVGSMGEGECFFIDEKEGEKGLRVWKVTYRLSF